MRRTLWRMIRAVPCGPLLFGSPFLLAQEPTPEEWREDLAFLTETIRAVHPDPFHRILEEEFERRGAGLSEELDRLSGPQAALALMRLVASLQDGHTSLRPRGRILSLERWYPLHLERFQDGVYVVGAAPDLADLLGARVVSAAGVPIERVIERLLEISFGDHSLGRLASVPFYLAMPEVLAAVDVGTGGPLSLETEDLEGRRSLTVVEPVEGEPDFDRFFAGWWPATGKGVTLPAPGPDLSGPLHRYRGIPYAAERDTALGIVYVRLNQLRDARGEVPVFGVPIRLGLEAFFDGVFEAVDGHGVETLVVDLRGNAGGNNRLALPLVEGIVSRPTLNRRGHLFVLVDRYTFSAAMNLVSLLEDRTAALFVGEPPGGSPLHFGDNIGFTLPHSGLRLNVSTVHWDLGVAPWDVREVMAVDLPAPLTSSDARSGRDPGMEAIRRFRLPDLPVERLRDAYRKEGLEAAFRAYERQRERRAVLPREWGAEPALLLEFAAIVLAETESAEEIYEAFRYVAERFPDSHEAWTALGRVYAFGRRWADAEAAYRRALDLRPSHDLIRRLWEAARRQR